MKFFNFKKIAILLAILALTLTVSAAGTNNSYDSANDPLVSLSYVEQVLKPQIIEDAKEEIIANLIEQYPNLGEGQGSSGSASSEYEVVHLNGGQILMAESSCEIIMTAGAGKVLITSQTNIDAGVGLNDLTTGNRILSNESLPAGHLVLIPRADGRGVAVTSADAYFMVRGEYSVASY